MTMEEKSEFRICKELLSLSNGAIFYRADLHNHTPKDPEFHCDGFPLTTVTEKKSFANAYVQTAIKNDVQILGISEHNDVSWIDYLRDAAKGSGLIIFPGIELGAKSGKRQIHFIALFDPNTTLDQLDHFMSSLDLPPDGRFHPDGTPRLCQKDSNELTKLIVHSPNSTLRGLPFAAHASSKNGLLNELEGESRVLAYQDSHLLAVEIPASRAQLPEAERKIVSGEANDVYGTKTVACLNNSDGRGLSQAKAGRNPIGTKKTLIKLSDFSIEALRQAFLDYDSRIRLEGEIREEKYPRIIGFAISGGFLSGKPNDNQEKSSPFLLHLNPNLNTVIGGRGAGKSALLETIRYVFDIPARTEESRQQSEKIIGFTLSSGSKAVILYELADSTRYIISRTKGFGPEVFAAATGEKVDVLPSMLLPGETPIEVYGQKEIFEISKDVNFQLTLLDTYVSESLQVIHDEERDLILSLKANALSILQIEEEVAQASQSLKDIQGIRLELQRMEKKETVKRLDQKKQTDREEALLRQANEAVENIITAVDKFRQNQQPLRESLPDKLSIESESIPNIELIKSEASRLERIDNLIAESLITLFAQIKVIWSEAIQQRTEWQVIYDRVQEEYKLLLNELGDVDFSADRYFSLRGKLQALLGLEQEISKRKKRLIELWTEREQKLDQLRLLRRNKEFTIRHEKAQHLTELLRGAIKINLILEGNREAYTQIIGELFAGHHINKDVFERLSNKKDPLTDPIDLVKAIRKEKEHPSDENSILNTVYGISPAYRSRLAEIEDSVLFELETYRIPDLPEISLKVGSQYRPLNPPPGKAGLSTGQKCTAILSIILVERNAPLIIDQPEDDLDNEFIFKEIVQTLRKEKERRQFIVATHNANIPVSGDAELIVLLQANEEHGWIEQLGSIDDPKMREPVENVLEGGRDAFLIRQKKYELLE